MSSQVLCNLQVWRLHGLSGQPPPVLNCSHWENIFLTIKSEFSMFQFVSVASHSLLLMLSLCNLQEKPGSVFSTPSPLASCGLPWDSPEPSLLLCEPAQLSQPFLIHLMPPAILVNLHFTLAYQSLSCTRGPKTGHGTLHMASQVLNRGEGSVHLPCWPHSC